MTARDVIGEAVARTDMELRSRFAKTRSFIRFESGRSVTIENAVTLMARTSREPFPLVALFTEGVRQTYTPYTLEFTIPKIAIIVKTLKDADEPKKIQTTFEPVLYPIRDELLKQLESVHAGYDFKATTADLPNYTSRQQTTGLNSLCDAVIIRDLRMKVLLPVVCG